MQGIFTLIHISKCNCLNLFSVEFPVEARVKLMQDLSEVEWHLSAGASEKIQLSAVIASFAKVKHMVAEMAAS